MECFRRAAVLQICADRSIQGIPRNREDAVSRVWHASARAEDPLAHLSGHDWIWKRCISGEHEDVFGGYPVCSLVFQWDASLHLKLHGVISRL